MDKYEYNLKIDQIRQAVDKRDIATAIKIADEIDWKKEKEVSVLMTTAAAYELGREYSKAKEVLLIAYEKAQSGRQLAYRLAVLAARTKDFDEAEEFYQDFVEMAPRDTARYVLQYKIARAKGEPIERLIDILEEYVDLDMEEKWMYELAKLYHLVGDEEKCVNLCDEMSLWFSHGEYVRRAMDLKKKYRPLTKTQEENYGKTDEEFTKDVKPKNISENNETKDSEESKESQLEEVHENKEVKQATIPFTTLKVDEFKNEKEVDKQKEDTDNDNIPGEIDIEDIHVTTLAGNGSDTIDLQAEIAKNMKEIMDSEEAMAQIKAENVAKPDKITMTLNPMFKYEGNGQIGLDIKEPQPVEKQITGQISIEEVLRNLEERGILKADTVNKTVATLDQAAVAVDEAANEAAIQAETEKESKTVVQDIDIKDLVDDDEMSEVENALESYAEDAANGFVFTDEIDSEAIEKVLQDSGEIPIPEINDATAQTKEMDDLEKVQDILGLANSAEEVLLEEGSAGIDTLEEETTVELSEDIPVLDLSFDAPLKKIHPGIAPASEPVAANTASLKELFADLDEATKREIGLLEEETESEVNTETVSDKEQDEVMENSNIDSEEAADVKDNIESTEPEEEPESEAEMESKTDVETQSEAEIEVTEEADEETISEEPEEQTVEEQLTEEIAEEKSGVTADENIKETKAEEVKKEDILQVKVTKNTNLTNTMSLNLDKIIVTDEEMEPFESFKTVNGLEQKIKDTVAELATIYIGRGNSENGNIMILGDDKSGKTTMAIELIKLINKKRERTGRRIAKVDSSVLNTRGIRSSMKKLVGSDLIVENAQHLRKSVLNEFVSVGEYYTDDMIMVFEGETSALKTMRNENEDIAEMFNHVLVIKEYDVKEWVAYAKKYLSTKNYMIDEMGTLALYKAIDDFYGKHQGIDQSDVENIVNRAIKKASKKVTRKFTNLFSGKNDETGMDILKEIDFK